MENLYRKNVGIVVADKDGRVLICARADQRDYQWQFPQGGIEKDEDIIAAAKRELYEETGLTSVEFWMQIPFSLRYDFPKNDKIHRFGNYIGQEQTWVLFRFLGNDNEINLKINPDEIEFKAFEWVDISIAPQRIVSFKKEVYQKVADYFKPYLNGTK